MRPPIGACGQGIGRQRAMKKRLCRKATDQPISPLYVDPANKSRARAKKTFHSGAADPIIALTTIAAELGAGPS